MISILLTFLLLAFVSATPPTSGGALQPDGKNDGKGNGRTRDGGPPEWANKGTNGRKRGKATFGFIDPTPQLPPGWQNGHKKDPSVVGGPPDQRVMVGPDVNGDLWEIEITDEAVGHARAALGLGAQDNSIDGKHDGALLETTSKDGYFFNQPPASGLMDGSVWPNNMVGYLSMGCTGTQIGYRVVATAAHCVYDTVNNVWGDVANTKWYPGMRTQPANHPAALTFRAYQFWASNAYISWAAYNPQYDWGAVILQTPANNLGYLGFSWRPTLPATVTHQGYPNNKFPNQWGDSCSPFGDNGITFNHYCDINPGSSGGPMFEAGPKVLGTQSGHYADGSGPNIAEKYNQDAFNNLLGYRNTYT